MKFNVTQNKNNNQWTVCDTVGTVIATAEAVSMSLVEVEGETFYGLIDAVWGAILTDAAYKKAGIIRGLSINRSFRNEGKRPAVLVDGRWVDSDTHEPVSHFDHLTLLGENAFY